MAIKSNLEGLKTLQKDVTSAGTAEVLHSGFSVPAGIMAIVKAKSANTGSVYLGGSKADAESTSARFELVAKQAVALHISNLNIVWLDAATSGEGVEILFETDIIG